MVILLGLAATVLYGSGDFLGGLATRRAHVLAVLTLAEGAGAAVALTAAAISPGAPSLAGLAWGIGAGLIGGLGLIIFYIGLAAGPMSVVAPVSGLVSTVLPVAVALLTASGPESASTPARCSAWSPSCWPARPARPARRNGTPARAGPSPTAPRQASRLACSSSSSVTPGRPGNYGRWRPRGSASWRLS